MRKKCWQFLTHGNLNIREKSWARSRNLGKYFIHSRSDRWKSFRRRKFVQSRRHMENVNFSMCSLHQLAAWTKMRGRIAHNQRRVSSNWWGKDRRRNYERHWVLLAQNWVSHSWNRCSNIHIKGKLREPLPGNIRLRFIRPFVLTELCQQMEIEQRFRIRSESLKRSKNKESIASLNWRKILFSISKELADPLQISTRPFLAVFLVHKTLDRSLNSLHMIEELKLNKKR